MNKIILCIMVMAMSATFALAQQEKTERKSPLDSVHIVTDDGVNIRIRYSRPSLNGRQIGQDVAPMGQVWRTGANEATVFEIDRDVEIQGQRLSAGKYSLYSISDLIASTIIFSKAWDQWGTEYDEAQDVLRITASQNYYEESVEQLTFFGTAKGKVLLSWGQVVIDFDVKAI